MTSAPPKIAVVTGASGGLGSELCKAIAAHGVGIVLVDRDPKASQAFAAVLNRAYPGSVRDAVTVDLASHADIKRLTSDLVARYPAIDYVFNNAGVLTETLKFSGYGNELHFEVNTLAPLALIDQLRPALKGARGTIVSTSAGLALQVKTLDWNDLIKPATFSKLFGPYAKSKEALNVLTAALANELSVDGITIRAADPGPNKTGLTKGAGTPLWMRLFASFLPAPDKGAKKIFDVGFASKWDGQTGVFVSGEKIRPLPPALADKSFQQNFLQNCRERASVS